VAQGSGMSMPSVPKGRKSSDDAGENNFDTKIRFDLGEECV
jgi:hypothetical protein